MGLGHTASIISCNDFNDDVITLTGDDVRVSNLKIVGGATGLVVDGSGTLEGVFIVNAQRAQVDNCFITNMGQRGIRVNSGSGHSSEDVVIRDNKITLCGRHGINANWHAARLQVLNNEIWNLPSGEANGVWSGNTSPDVIIAGNSIHDVNDMGIEIFSVNGPAVVANNSIVSTGNMGISVVRTKGATVTGNSIRSCSNTGIEFIEADLSTCCGNTVVGVGGAGKGILLNQTDDATVVGNTISTTTAAIRSSNTVQRAAIIGNVITDCVNGYNMAAPYHDYDILFQGNHIENTSGDAILNSGGGMFRFKILDNNIMDPTGEGMDISSCLDVTIEGNSITDTAGTSTQEAILMTGHSSNTVFIRNNKISGFGGAGGEGIELGSNYSGTCWVEDNYIPDATTAIVDNSSSATLYIRRNIGYVTENRGTATVANGTTSIAVSHGLAVTPNAGDISVHPIETLNSASFFWVDTITSTQFTINVNADPGADVDFAWKIDK
jgi:hypothetical protein